MASDIQVYEALSGVNRPVCMCVCACVRVCMRASARMVNLKLVVCTCTSHASNLDTKLDRVYSMLTHSMLVTHDIVTTTL